MAIWPFNRQVETKEHPNGGGFVVNGPVPWGRAHDAQSYIREGYQLNVIVYRAITEIVKAATSLEIELYDATGNLAERNKVLDLLERPTPMHTWESWLTEMLVNRMIMGEMACARPDGQMQPAELWPLKPSNIEIETGRGGIPLAYVHKVNKVEKRFQVKSLTGESDLMFSKTYNPDNYWRGQSPLMAAALSVDTHNEGMRWNYGLLANGARPSGLIKFTGTPSGEVIQRLQEFIGGKYSGGENAGKMAYTDAEFEWVELSKSAKDMDYLNTLKETAKYVASALGVPLPLIDNDASTFNNLEQAKERLYTDTVIPVVKELLAALNSWLLPGYGEGLKLRIDMDAIPALEGLRERTYARAMSLYEKGLLTRQEARELIGYEPEGEGDFKRDGGGIFDLPPDDVKAMVYGLETKI